MSSYHPFRKLELELKACDLAGAARDVLADIGRYKPTLQFPKLEEALNAYDKETERFSKYVYWQVSEAIAKHLIPCLEEYLNRLRGRYPEAIHELCETRVRLDEDEYTDEDPPLVVTKLPGKEGLHFGIIGIINGIIEDLCDMNRFRIAGLYDETDTLVEFRMLDMEKPDGGVFDKIATDCVVPYLERLSDKELEELANKKGSDIPVDRDIAVFAVAKMYMNDWDRELPDGMSDNDEIAKFILGIGEGKDEQ
jgi:hypothetical protein